MTLTVNRRVWVLAERLYIHIHEWKQFIQFLRQFGIDYPGEPYKGFRRAKGLYTFMSEDD